MLVKIGQAHREPQIDRRYPPKAFDRCVRCVDGRRHLGRSASESRARDHARERRERNLWLLSEVSEPETSRSRALRPSSSSRCGHQAPPDRLPWRRPDVGYCALAHSQQPWLHPPPGLVQTLTCLEHTLADAWLSSAYRLGLKRDHELHCSVQAITWPSRSGSSRSHELSVKGAPSTARPLTGLLRPASEGQAVQRHGTCRPNCALS
jgi:hypothetical protein